MIIANSPTVLALHLTILSTLYIVLSSRHPYEVGTIMIPGLQRRRRKHREIEKLSRFVQLVSWDRNPGKPNSESRLLTSRDKPTRRRWKQGNEVSARARLVHEMDTMKPWTLAGAARGCAS